MKNFIILFSLFIYTSLAAQISITTGNLISIDFNSYAANGFAPSAAAGQLDSDNWRVTGLSDGDGVFGGTHSTGDFARGPDPGGVTTGGLYAFGISIGDTAFGFQPITADFTPGSITLRLVNNTGAPLTNLNVQYLVYVFNDQDRSNSFNFSFSDDDVSYTDVPALDFASIAAADALPVWVSELKSTSLSTLNIANNDTLYLRWTGDDVGGSGSRDEFAIDNILISEGDTPLPIELISFQAIAGDEKIYIRWSTASEINNQGFEIYKSDDDGGTYNLLDSYIWNEDLNGAGTSSAAHNYSYTDLLVDNGQRYWYKLVDVSFNGERAEHGPVSAIADAVVKKDPKIFPEKFILYDNYPNPFNPKTTINFDVPALRAESIHLSLNIYNMLGQKIETLFQGQLGKGNYSFDWDGTDINGKGVPSGLYIYQVVSEKFVQSKKMMLFK